MKIKHILAGLAAAALLTFGAAQAQVSLPQVQTINPDDLFQDVVKGVPSAQNQYASALQLAGYADSLPGSANVLIGGDATTNLFQRATTGASVTTTATYGGPDRWFYWSGTNTAMTVSRTTTAADLPASGFTAGFKMAKTAAQTGVVQTCMAQVVETSNSMQFAGQTAELSFYATAGATFSAASSNVTAYVVYGTGTNEGAAAMAFGLNAGGGAGAGWTGQANGTAAVIPISTVNNRYAAVASIPATATEIGVALCFTPVGTAGANDYVSFSGIQLVRNASLIESVDTNSGYTCAPTSASPAIDCTAFNGRLLGAEASLQYRYFYKVTESAAIFPFAPCVAVDTTHTNCLVAFPVPMRIAPTLTAVAGFASPTSTTQATLGACSALAAATTVTSTVAATTAQLVNCTATTIPAAGVGSFLYSNNGSGTLSFNSEL
jgi:hypothetical protein